MYAFTYIYRSGILKFYDSNEEPGYNCVEIGL